MNFCVFFLALNLTSFQWVIPENIHTIPQTAFRISEGEGGVQDYGILRAWGGIYDWISEGTGDIPQVGFLE